MKVFSISLHGVIAGTLVATAAPAFADDYKATAYESSHHERSGLVLGASIDGGAISCHTESNKECGNDAHSAGGFSVHVGGMISPTVAILGEAWVMAHTEDSLTATQLLATANVRGWIAPRLWLQGGLGVARSKLSFNNDRISVSAESATVPAISGAVGLELVRTHTFGLDLELRGGSGLSRDNVRISTAALGIGATFF